MLNHEIPVVVVFVLAIAGDRFRREELIGGIEERGQGEAERGEIRIGQRIAGHEAFRRVGEVVVLVGAVVDAKARTNGRLAVE